MPYHWSPNPSETPDAVCFTAHIRPHRSLSAKGFEQVIWLMFLGLCLPLLSFIGTAAFWILLGFTMTALAGVWIAIRRSDRDKLCEILTLTRDRLELSHRPAKGETLHWSSNPYWAKLTCYPDVGGIENYLTLKGGTDTGPQSSDAPTREVQLGVFLSPEEREQLFEELDGLLAHMRQPVAR